GTQLAAAATAGVDAMQQDLGALANIVSAVSGLDIAFVASPSEAVKLQLRVGPTFDFPVLASSALAAKTVVCVGLNALAAALEPVPTIEFVKDATIVMDDAAAAFATGGTIAAGQSIRSLWQSDAVGVKFEMTLDWALRDSRGALPTSR